MVPGLQLPGRYSAMATWSSSSDLMQPHMRRTVAHQLTPPSISNGQGPVDREIRWVSRTHLFGLPMASAETNALKHPADHVGETEGRTTCRSGYRTLTTHGTSPSIQSAEDAR